MSSVIQDENIFFFLALADVKVFGRTYSTCLQGLLYLMDCRLWIDGSRDLHVQL